MGLRAKAEAQRDERIRRERQDREHQQREREAEARERAEPAARYLSEWTGETVRPHELREAKSVGEFIQGPPRWSVTVDGFDLEIVSAGDASFAIWQIGDNGATRQVFEPMDLLDNWPVHEEVKDQ